MRLVNISLGNLRRRKLKMALLVMGLVIGVASIVGLYSITTAMEEDLANKIDAYGSNMLIIPGTGDETVTIGGVTVEGIGKVPELDMSSIETMKTIKNKETLAIIAPKLLADDQINGKRALLVGVQFKNELRLKKWWQITWQAGEQKLPSEKEIIAGSDAARVLGLKPGQTVNIKGQEFTVAGIINETGSSENDSALFIDLGTLQRLVNRPGALSLIETAAFCYTCPIEEVTRQLREVLPGTTVKALKESTESRDVTVKRFAAFSLVVSAVILLVGGLVVMISMLSAVKERTREIGVFRATGFRKGHIMQIILTEAVILSLIGGLLGYILGMATASVLGPLIAQMEVKVVWQPLLAVYSAGGAILLGLLASAYPAYRAAQLDPVEALRYI